MSSLSTHISGQSVSMRESMSAARELMRELANKAPQSVREYVRLNSNQKEGSLNKKSIEFLLLHADEIDALCDQYKNDLDADYIVANMFASNYCVKRLDENNDLVLGESPIQLYMRVAVLLSGYDMTRFRTVFADIVNRRYSHGSATLFNACLGRQQLSSCFLSGVQDDFNSISDWWRTTGLISKYNGGIGLDLTRLRHSIIGNVGLAKGIIEVMRILDNIIRYSNQGGKRNGAMTVYLRDFHIDFMDFLEAVNRHANPSHRMYQLTFGVWLSDLFMERVARNETWTLFCPYAAPELCDAYGQRYRDLYMQYEAKRDVDPFVQRWSRQVQARDVWVKIAKMASESARLFVLNGDAANALSNQSVITPINCSNLCTEIVQVSAPTRDSKGRNYISSCNIAAINLASCCEPNYDETPRTMTEDKLIDQYDFNLLGRLARETTVNLDNVIDETWYFDGVSDLKERIANLNTALRNIGIGVCGFWDALCKMNIPFTSDLNGDQLHPLASRFNRLAFACIYFNSICASVNMAVTRGRYSVPDDLWQDTACELPLDQGKFKFDLYQAYRKTRGDEFKWPAELDEPVQPSEWGQTPYALKNGHVIEPTWNSLRRAIRLFGVRNTEFTTIMPTSNTATLNRVTECVQPPDDLLYAKKLVSGTYVCHNPLLWNELAARFSPDIADEAERYIYAQKTIKGLSSHLQLTESQRHVMDNIAVKYLTGYEVRPRHLIYLAAERMRYISQSHSLNVFLNPNTSTRVQQILNYGHRLGLTTMLYYIYNRPAKANQDFTESIRTKQTESDPVCTMKAGCVSCAL